MKSGNNVLKTTLALFLLGGAGLQAETFSVTRTTDDGTEGTLSWAIERAAEVDGDVSLKVSVTPNGRDYLIPLSEGRLLTNGNRIYGLFTMTSPVPGVAVGAGGSSTLEFVELFGKLSRGEHVDYASKGDQNLFLRPPSMANLAIPGIDVSPPPSSNTEAGE